MGKWMTLTMGRREFLRDAVLLVGGVAVSGSFTVPAGAADGSAPAQIRVYSAEKGSYVMTQTVVKTNEEWKKVLTPEQYHILREKGTERAFSGKYDKNHEHGVYRCAACGLDLYRSEEKFDSGTGWPSFTAPIAAGERPHPARQRFLFAAYRGALPPVRGTPWPCIRRRAETDREALLHELGGPAVRGHHEIIRSSRNS